MAPTPIKPTAAAAGAPPLSAEDFAARLLYRDALMLVIDKPAGLPVHPGPKGGVTLRDYLESLRFGLPRPPELAHRLDKDTSGCLVLGRHARALARLGALFGAGRVEKTYIGVVEGGPLEAAGDIDMPLSRRAKTRGWWMKADASGQPARTLWRVLARGAEHTVLELQPLTGRTHQLRVHLAESGWPLIGDAVYGRAPRSGPLRLMLHARTVSVPLYPNRPPVVATAPVPADMLGFMAAPLRGISGTASGFSISGSKPEQSGL